MNQKEFEISLMVLGFTCMENYIDEKLNQCWKFRVNELLNIRIYKYPTFISIYPSEGSPRIHRLKNEDFHSLLEKINNEFKRV